MPLTTTATWPSLIDGKKAKASEVEQKFDWIEGQQLPMVGGAFTTGVYDLGSSSYKWRNGYFLNAYADELTITTPGEDEWRASFKAWAYAIGFGGTISGDSFNISSIALLTTGVFQINFTTGFATNTYAAFPLAVANSAVIATASDFTTSSVYARFFTDAGVAANSRFDFLATGE